MAGPMKLERLRFGDEKTNIIEADVDNTVDGSEIRVTTWDVENHVNTEITTNQLVSWISSINSMSQSTVRCQNTVNSWKLMDVASWDSHDQ